MRLLLLLIGDMKWKRKAFRSVWNLLEFLLKFHSGPMKWSNVLLDSFDSFDKPLWNIKLLFYKISNKIICLINNS